MAEEKFENRSPDAVRVLHPERMPLEGDAARALARFTAQVKTDVAAWRDFRISFAGAIPGRSTFKDASDLLLTIRRGATPPSFRVKGTRIFLEPPLALLPDLSPVPDYLITQITPEDLGLIREMTNFSGRPYVGQAETAQLFGFPWTPTLHRYAIEIRMAGKIKGTFGIGAGLSRRSLRL